MSEDSSSSGPIDEKELVNEYNPFMQQIESFVAEYSTASKKQAINYGKALLSNVIKNQVTGIHLCEYESARSNGPCGKIAKNLIDGKWYHPGDHTRRAKERFEKKQEADRKRKDAEKAERDAKRFKAMLEKRGYKFDEDSEENYPSDADSLSGKSSTSDVPVEPRQVTSTVVASAPAAPAAVTSAPVTLDDDLDDMDLNDEPKVLTLKKKGGRPKKSTAPESQTAAE